MREFIKLSLILMMFAIFMIISCVVNAATYDIYTYVANGTEATITGCNTNASGNIVVPEQINGYRVTKIDSEAFYNCKNITEIIVPKNVTSIGDYAFSGCTNLLKITIPNGVISIGNFAFSKCAKLTKVVIPDSVESIGAGAFSQCYNLSEVKISESVKNIATFTFNTCTSLVEITIPNSVVSIGERAFSNCTSLKKINIPDNLETLDEWVFYTCLSLTEIVIPGSIKNVGEYAFKDCNRLTKVTIKDGVSSIGDFAFENCSGLKEITIPGSVTSIGGYVFFGCDSLAEVVIMDGVPSIGDFAFYGCGSLAKITIPDSVESIGNYAISACSNLKNIKIPNSVMSIGDKALQGCSNLEDITIPFVGSQRGNNQTEDSVFGYIFGISKTPLQGYTEQRYKKDELIYSDIPLSLKKVTVTDETIVPYGAFYNCKNLTDVIIEGNPKVISENAFYGHNGEWNVVVHSIDVNIVNSALFSGGDKPILYGYDNSTFQEYAKNYNLKFTSLSDDRLDVSAELIENKVVLKVNFDPIILNENLHVALYDSVSNLIDYMIVPVDEGVDSMSVIFKYDSNISLAKVFLWDSITFLTPVINAIRVNIDIN